MRNAMLIVFAGCYLKLVVFLAQIGAPVWLVNTPQMLLHALVPDSLRIAAFAAWMRRNEARAACREGRLL